MIKTESSYAEVWETITPSDTAIANYKNIYVTVAGNLALEDKNGNSVIFPVVVTGIPLPWKPAKVLATGTTTAVVIGLR